MAGAFSAFERPLRLAPLGAIHLPRSAVEDLGAKMLPCAAGELSHPAGWRRGCLDRRVVQTRWATEGAFARA
jgi:hypothetical protein